MIIAIYSRKSKLTQKGDSIHNQIQSCKNYASQHFATISDIIIYTDEGFSGGNTNRPMFQKMMDDAVNKKFHVLICYRLDRISRSIAQFSTTYELLEKHNIEFVSVKEQFDTSSPIGRAMLNIAMVFAQLERETIAERIRDNMHALARSGRWLGGTCPTGFKSIEIDYYDKNQNKKKMYKLSPIAKEVELVELLFDQFLILQKLRQVEAYCFKHEIKSKNNCKLSAASIRDILINPVYARGDQEIYSYFKLLGSKLCGSISDYDGSWGLAAYNRTDQTSHSPKAKSAEEWIISLGRHKGIIPGYKWVQVQKILKKNSR